MTKITKDELIKLNAELQNELATLKAQDESLREDLSSVLNAPTVETTVFGKKERKLYSWNEIFGKVGALQNEAAISYYLKDKFEQELSDVMKLHEALRNIKNNFVIKGANIGINVPEELERYLRQFPHGL